VLDFSPEASGGNHFKVSSKAPCVRACLPSPPLPAALCPCRKKPAPCACEGGEGATFKRQEGPDYAAACW